MMDKVKLGVVGFGNQVRSYHLPALQALADPPVEIAWVRAFDCDGDPRDSPLGQRLVERGTKFLHSDAWPELAKQTGSEAVLISTPNSMHAADIVRALENGMHVAVDKPTTIDPKDCTDLVRTAEAKRLVFLTIAQRRYERVYTHAREQMVALGGLRCGTYTISHQLYGKKDSWTWKRSLAGGGALISSGYHGLDILLWLLRASDPDTKLLAVSAEWDLDWDRAREDDSVESFCMSRIRLRHQGQTAYVSALASFEGPTGSIDENIRLFGTQGSLRITREALKQQGDSAALLSFQNRTDGQATVVNTSGWKGDRAAPVLDFARAVACARGGGAPRVFSPAAESIDVVRLTAAAYRSAQNNGIEIAL